VFRGAGAPSSVPRRGEDQCPPSEGAERREAHSTKPTPCGARIRIAGRVASRRSTAAILGLGTVLPGLGRLALRQPYRGAFAPLVLSRPALAGSPP
jgi:hypothetical protein